MQLTDTALALMLLGRPALASFCGGRLQVPARERLPLRQLGVADTAGVLNRGGHVLAPRYQGVHPGRANPSSSTHRGPSSWPTRFRQRPSEPPSAPRLKVRSEHPGTP